MYLNNQAVLGKLPNTINKWCIETDGQAQATKTRRKDWAQSSQFHMNVKNNIVQWFSNWGTSYSVFTPQKPFTATFRGLLTLFHTSGVPLLSGCLPKGFFFIFSKPRNTLVTWLCIKIYKSLILSPSLKSFSYILLQLLLNPCV